MPLLISISPQHYQPLLHLVDNMPITVYVVLTDMLVVLLLFQHTGTNDLSEEIRMTRVLWALDSGFEHIEVDDSNLLEGSERDKLREEEEEEEGERRSLYLRGLFVDIEAIRLLLSR